MTTFRLLPFVRSRCQLFLFCALMLPLAGVSSVRADEPAAQSDATEKPKKRAKKPKAEADKAKPDDAAAKPETKTEAKAETKAEAKPADAKPADAKAEAKPGEAKPGDEVKPAETFKVKYERAVMLYKSGQYEKAVDEFRAAYEMKPAPLLLFNIAQALRKGDKKKEALDLYERFLREQPTSELKGETETYIGELKTQISAEEEANKIAAAKLAAEKAAAEKAAADKVAADLAAAERAEKFRLKYGPTRPLNITKWTLLGAGIALSIAGGVLMGLDGKPVCDMPMETGQKLCPKELDTKLTGGIILGGGLLSIAGSAVVFGLDYKYQREAKREMQQASLPSLTFSLSGY